MISCSISATERTNAPGKILAFCVAAALHVLGLLAWWEELKPKTDAARSQSAALTVTLIPPETPVSPPAIAAPSTATPASRAARPMPKVRQRDIARRKQAGAQTEQRVRKEARPALPATSPAPGNNTSQQSLDWQADLGRIGKQGAARYGNASAITLPKAAGRQQAASSALERGISKAARDDCRNAYAQMGLFSVPMLALDMLKNSGCKW